MAAILFFYFRFGGNNSLSSSFGLLDSEIVGLAVEITFLSCLYKLRYKYFQFDGKLRYKYFQFDGRHFLSSLQAEI